jgi:tRNA(Ile)-lysidine synthetase-like protein
LRVRNWRAGDRFEPAHSGGPKKIKELLQEMHISGTARKLWPVILAGDEIVWLRGLASPYCPKVGDKVIVVRETPQKAEC